jgi:outer membrane protein assembly factor BamB
MKRSTLLFTALVCSAIAYSQKVFFKSSQTISPEHRMAFYASLNINDSLVLFNAPDYQLYAYNKNSGEQIWGYKLGRKSDFPPFFSGNYIWATNGDRQVIKLDPATGTLLDTLPASTIETQPFLKNDILHFTGLYDGGCLIAYDMKADSVLWKRFLAHGYSKTPYYLADKIVANAEGDNWIELNYDGTLKEAGCDKDAIEGDFPSQLPCAKQFIALTHDGKEIKGKLAEELSLDIYSVPAIATTAKHSFLLNDGLLFILGNKLKKKSSLLLTSLSDDLEENSNAPAKILSADDEKITMLYSHHFIIYHHRDKKLLKLIDLAQWEPHQVMLNEDKLWLISRKDGLLYGITIN